MGICSCDSVINYEDNRFIQGCKWEYRVFCLNVSIPRSSPNALNPDHSKFNPFRYKLFLSHPA